MVAGSESVCRFQERVQEAWQGSVDDFGENESLVVECGGVVFRNDGIEASPKYLRLCRTNRAVQKLSVESRCEESREQSTIRPRAWSGVVQPRTAIIASTM